MGDFLRRFVSIPEGTKTLIPLKIADQFTGARTIHDRSTRSRAKSISSRNNLRYSGSDLAAIETTNITHTIHVAGIFTYIWLMFMVNVGKYTIHGC